MSNPNQHNQTAAGASESSVMALAGYWKDKNAKDFPTSMVVALGNYETIEQLEAAIHDANCMRSWDKDMTISMAYPPGTYELCEVEGWALGQTANLSREEVCKLGAQKGFQECPQQVGPQLIIQGLVRKHMMETKIASTEPIRGETNIMMSVNGRLGTAAVHCEYDPPDGFSPMTSWIFIKAKQ